MGVSFFSIFWFLIGGFDTYIISWLTAETLVGCGYDIYTISAKRQLRQTQE
jgi:hypothetical protein